MEPQRLRNAVGLACYMARETLIGGYLLRLTRLDGRVRIVLRDLTRRDTLEFETSVAAWAFIDQLVRHAEERSSENDD